jgi:hypothetical protein
MISENFLYSLLGIVSYGAIIVMLASAIGLIVWALTTLGRFVMRKATRPNEA